MTTLDVDDLGLLSAGKLSRRKGTPGLVADLLRDRITTGQLRPGTRLPVDKVSQSIGVSANTVREALQLLERERLVTQHLNRGIFVSELDADDIADMYRMRRFLELGVLRAATDIPTPVLAAIKRAVDAGEQALDEEDWVAAGNSTTAFHSALVAIAGSERVTTTMQQLLAELRLLMSPLEDHTEIHRVFVTRHREIWESLSEGNFAKAEAELAEYLDAGERALTDLFGEKANEVKPAG